MGAMVMAQETYLDNFNTTSYSNNNGTLNFAANWIETNDDNDPDDGDIDIKDNELRFDDISDNNSSIRRALNLSGATSVVLTFDYDAETEDRNDAVLHAQLWNATTSLWETIATINTDTSGSISHTLTVNQISSASSIRFIDGSPGGDWDGGEILIDNVLFTATFGPPNVPPVLTATGDQVYCAGTAMPVVETISITDTDDTTAFAVAIQISSGYINGEDLLTLTGMHPNITPSWSPVEGKLSLAGPATLAEFEAAVSGVDYSSSALNPTGSRGFSITVGDANFLPLTGHYYEFVSVLGITWTAARTAASLRTYYGLQGYLATLTSQEEADFSGSQALGVGWIGGSDAAVEDRWLWVTGPEAGLNFWNGTAGGSSPTFAFWNTGEPNQSGDEDYAHITHPNVNPNGSWNDLTNTGAASGNYQPQGYVVEYGGMPGDPVLSITATTTLTMDTIDPTASNPAPINLNCTSEVPAPDVSVVTDEADNCTANPIVTYINDVSDGGSNPEIITRTYSITDDAGNSTNVTQIITVSPFIITTQPANIQVFAGSTGNFIVVASNVDTYQWQVSTNGGGSFINLTDGPEYSGSNTNTLTVLDPEIEMDGFLYRVVLSNSSSSCPAIYSNNALLNVVVSTVITNRRITYRVNRN